MKNKVNLLLSVSLLAPLIATMVYTTIPRSGLALETATHAAAPATVSTVVTGKTAKATKSEDKKSKEGDFARGAKLWADRCSACHNLRDPKDLTDSEWSATVTHMRIRAGLSGQDARDILAFLQKSN